MRTIGRLDVFPKFDLKFEQDARQRTVSGGVLSIVALVFISLLVVSECRYFFSVTEDHEMYVDPAIGGEMTITANLTFPRVPCDLISLDSVDSFGQYADGIVSKTVKTRVEGETLNIINQARPIVDDKRQPTRAIDPDGAEKENCPSCYGAEMDPGDCCQTCNDVRIAYGRKNWHFNVDDISIEQCAEERVRQATMVAGREGCNIYAHFAVARVTGNIYFVPGRAFTVLGRHMLDFAGSEVRKLNLSHIIHKLEFGDHFDGQLNPLDGHVSVRGAENPEEAVSGRFTYFVKVVPTQVQSTSLVLGFNGNNIESNQYSVTEHFSSYPPEGAAGRFIPGVFMTYEMSPIKVRVSHSHPYPSLMHFILQLCAICGGVFTVIGLVDSLFFHGIRRVQYKMQQGKLT